jgi:hypothetical protein
MAADMINVGLSDYHLLLAYRIISIHSIQMNTSNQNGDQLVRQA